MPTGRHETARQRLLWPLLIIGGIFAVFMGVVIALYFAPHPALLFTDGKAARTDFARTRTLAIGDVTVTVPRPYLGEIDRTIFGPVRRVSLRLPWPYQPQRAMTDAEAGDLTRILAIDLVMNTEKSSPAERLARIYPVYFEGLGEEVGEGLVKYSFKPGTPYQDTTLYVVNPAGASEPILISCTLEGETPVPPLCEHRLVLSDKVTAVYRFHEDHVMDWREIDTTVKELLADFRKDAGI